MKKHLALILVVIAMLSLVGCGKEEAKEESIAVTVEGVKSGELRNISTFEGTTKAQEETNVFIELQGGTVENINVEVGQSVKKGDILLTLDGGDVQANVNVAKAAVDSARASSNAQIEQSKIQIDNALKSAQLAYDESKRNFDIQTELYKAEAISEQAYKQVEFSYNQAKQNLDAAIKNYNDVLPSTIDAANKGVLQAEASYESAARNIDKLTLRAPIDGVISEKNCNENELISQQMPAFVISNPSTMQIDLKVTGNDIDKFKVGQEANIIINGENTTGTIKTVPTVTNENTALYTVEVVFNNIHNEFKTGMSAEVEISIEEVDDSLNIPSKAIIEEDGKKYIYILTSDKRAKKVEITTGLETVDRTQIKTGIDKDKTVVVAGLSLIHDGTKLFPVTKEE